MHIRIVGAGLIGTSIGLGLKNLGHQISFEDNYSPNLAVAQDLLGGGEFISTPPEVIVVATPVDAAFQTLKSEFASNPQATFIDICGLKSNLVSEVDHFPELAKRFCGSHPMAGREISGPTAARADLFEGATWILTPTTLTEKKVLELAESIARDLGAVVSVVPAAMHDQAIAALSHAPQILSSLLAGNLLSLESEEIALAGQGLRDMTRLADSNPELWATLLIENSENISTLLHDFVAQLTALNTSVKNGDKRSVQEFISRGNKGKAAIPGKHGGKSREYSFLPIVIDDKPGQLAEIFEECSIAQVNVEDLFIEHSPGQDTGLITLALSHDDAKSLQTHLTLKNWRVHGIRAQR